MTKLIALTVLAVFGAPAVAQDMPMASAAAPVCPKDAEPIPAALAAWAVRTPLAADSAALAKAVVTPGTAYDVSLAETPAVTYAVQPSHPGSAASHGGLVSFTIAQAGTYRVAIGAAAWLDVVRGSTALQSAGHGHGPACSGIRKMVDFALQPGAYTLQIAGNDKASIALLIARLN